jgi:hypothetical protein
MLTWMAVGSSPLSRSATPWETVHGAAACRKHSIGNFQCSCRSTNVGPIYYSDKKKSYFPDTAYRYKRKSTYPSNGDCSIPACVLSYNTQKAWLNSVEQSPWDANRSAASGEIPRILWNSKVNPPSQEPATCPYPKPDESSPRIPVLFLEGSFWHYPPLYV